MVVALLPTIAPSISQPPPRSARGAEQLVPQLVPCIGGAPAETTPAPEERASCLLTTLWREEKRRADTRRGTRHHSGDK